VAVAEVVLGAGLVVRESASTKQSRLATPAMAVALAAVFLAAPQSIVDFMKQRRRWFVGLVKVARYAPSSLRHRLPLAAFLLPWGLAWIVPILVAAVLALRLDPPGLSRVGGDLALALYLMHYTIGLKFNLDDHEAISGPRRVAYYVLQLGLMPAFSVLESLSVLYGLAWRRVTFHVIRK
jgi:egghead protein (zeste-white 4 protein)